MCQKEMGITRFEQVCRTGYDRKEGRGGGDVCHETLDAHVWLSCFLIRCLMSANLHIEFFGQFNRKLRGYRKMLLFMHTSITLVLYVWRECITNRRVAKVAAVLARLYHATSASPIKTS